MSKENVAQVSQVDVVLAKALEGLLDTFQAGKDFVLEQAPEVIQQLLAWHFAFSLISAIMCFIVVLVVLYFTFVKNAWMMDYNDSVGAGVVPMGVLFFIFVPCTIVNAFEALKIYIAPKVWLLEYAADLVR